MALLWVLGPWCRLEVYRRFRGARCLHRQGDKHLCCVFWYRSLDFCCYFGLNTMSYWPKSATFGHIRSRHWMSHMRLIFTYLVLQTSYVWHLQQPSEVTVTVPILRWCTLISENSGPRKTAFSWHDINSTWQTYQTSPDSNTVAYIKKRD
jgi:hypothetical protein